MMKLSLLLCLLFNFSAFPFEVPPFTPNVVDTTQHLSRNDIAELNQHINVLRTQGGLAAILMVPTLGGKSIEDAAEQAFREWQLGRPGQDNGLLILVALHEQQMRIEVGYGLEETLTDFYCSEIIDKVLKPSFRTQHYAEGLSAALKEIGLQLQGQAPALVTYSPWHFVQWDEVGLQMGFWMLLMFGVPAFWQRRALKVALRDFPQNVATLEHTGDLDLTAYRWGFWKIEGVIFKVFLLFFPFVALLMYQYYGARPLFYVGHGLAFIFNFIILFLCRWSMRVLTNEAAFQQHQAMKQRSEAMAGKWSHALESSGSSSSSSSSTKSKSSSSSDSSSSKGGRSGGGGASGNW